MSTANEGALQPQLVKEARVRAKLAATIPQHVAIVSKDVLQRLEIAEGREIWAEHEGKRSQFTARAGAVPADIVELHPEDLKTLGIAEGSELLLRPSKQS